MRFRLLKIIRYGGEKREKNERKRKRGRLGKQIKKNNTWKERKIRFGNSKANKKKSENRIKLLNEQN